MYDHTTGSLTQRQWSCCKVSWARWDFSFFILNWLSLLRWNASILICSSCESFGMSYIFSIFPVNFMTSLQESILFKFPKSSWLGNFVWVSSGICDKSWVVDGFLGSGQSSLLEVTCEKVSWTSFNAIISLVALCLLILTIITNSS